MNVPTLKKPLSRSQLRRYIKSHLADQRRAVLNRTISEKFRVEEALTLHYDRINTRPRYNLALRRKS